MKEIKIKFEAVGSVDTVDDVCSNFYQNYPKFAAHMEEEDYKYNKKTKDFMLLWVGEFQDDELDEYDMDTLIRLTHHAEGFYDDTDAEYVHVEACVDGKWYGR